MAPRVAFRALSQCLLRARRGSAAFYIIYDSARASLSLFRCRSSSSSRCTAAYACCVLFFCAFTSRLHAARADSRVRKSMDTRVSGIYIHERDVTLIDALTMAWRILTRRFCVVIVFVFNVERLFGKVMNLIFADKRIVFDARFFSPCYTALRRFGLGSNK